MNTLANARQLSQAINKATRSARYCVSGCLPKVDPQLVVEGVGAIKFPLKPAAVRNLIAQCRVAPYGQGTQTLVDKRVRNTLELDPKQFRLGPEWTAAVERVARRAGEELGLPPTRIEARLYKLLVYEKGGFFLPHRDSEKDDGMVASLIVVLPNPFSGGALEVRHGAVQQTLRFEEAAAGKASCYAAFYADCEHEVKRLERGVRLCLAYNLVLKPTEEQPLRGGGADDELTAAIRSWTTTQPTAPLVFALEHHYTERGLSLDLLKGADRQAAELLVPAAERADCLVHLAQVSRHLLQFADDGSFERESYWGQRRRRALEIGETYEDDLEGSQWTDLTGKKQPWDSIPLDLANIVSSIPVNDWKPTSEQYEGYTGNAGNTLDRWYHRSAIVLWQKEHHFDVVAHSGAVASLPLFRAMTTKLAKTPKKRLEEARRDCVRFARAIVARWPTTHRAYWRYENEQKSPLQEFPELLLSLHDQETNALFLSRVAEVDALLRLDAFVLAICREFGWSAFAGQLRQLMAAPPPDPRWPRLQQRVDISLRDLEWLAALSLDKAADADRAALVNELCAVAVERFCAPLPPPQPGHYWGSSRRERSLAEESLPLLLKALLAGGRDAELSRVIQFVETVPEAFNLDDCQVPTLKALVPWSQKRFGEVHAHLVSWLTSVRHKLEAATASEPRPPADWQRPAEVACNCPYCAQLKAFLADPANEVGRIRAREDLRRHVLGTIRQHQCDVDDALDRKSSPHTLVLTKNTGSYERAVKRFEADRRLLKVIEEIGQDNTVRGRKERGLSSDSEEL